MKQIPDPAPLRTAPPDVVGDSLAVLHVIDDLRVGGAQRLLVTLSEDTGPLLAMRVLSLAGGDTKFSAMLAEAGVEVEKIGLRRMASPIGWIRLFRRLSAAKEDIVHLHLTYATVMAAPLARLLGKRVVVTLHNVDRISGNKLSGAFIKRLETYCLRHFVDHVVAVGEEVLESHVDRLDPSRTEVLVNVLPPAKEFEPGFRCRKRRELSARETDVALLSTGRLSPQKDHLNLLSAFVQVHANFPNAVLWIAGDGRLRSRLEEAARSLNIEERVSMLGLRSDVEELMEAADIFVLSSAWEGFPVALLEAMAQGLPPVATDVGDVCRIIDGDNGIVVPAKNPKQLADAILVLCNDQELRSRLARNAASSARRFTDIAGWKQSLVGIYRRVL